MHGMPSLGNMQCLTVKLYWQKIHYSINCLWCGSSFNQKTELHFSACCIPSRPHCLVGLIFQHLHWCGIAGCSRCQLLWLWQVASSNLPSPRQCWWLACWSCKGAALVKPKVSLQAWRNWGDTNDSPSFEFSLGYAQSFLSCIASTECMGRHYGC